MAASIHDVAKRAGVSISTVSRILNNSAAVSEKKAAAVREAMEFYHYEPNQFGRGLVKQTSRMIGVYFPYSAGSVFESSYNLELLKGMERVLTKNGYSLVLIGESEDYETRTGTRPKFMEYIGQKRIDGLLLSGITRKSMAEEAFHQMMTGQYPMVYIGKRLHEKGYNVYAQYEEYTFRMVDTLYGKGHRKILMFYLKNTHEDHVRRIEERVKKERKDTELYLIDCADYMEVQREQIKYIIERYFRQYGCTAVCSLGMEHTRLILSICAELKISVPEDLSILSVEHKKSEGQLEYPAVSAFYVPARDMGLGAANLLLSVIREEEIQENCVEYVTSYIERDSIRHL